MPRHRLPARSLRPAPRDRNAAFGLGRPGRPARGRRGPGRGTTAELCGAVGSDFSLEVEADHSVVQLGEPISLRFHLRGRGDLSAAGLPPLTAEGLFDPALFRLPDEAPARLLDEDGKHFEVTLRVLDASGREIPPLAYSWFDAETRRSGGGAPAGAGGSPPSAGEGDDADRGTAASDAQTTAAGAEIAKTARRASLAESAANLALERDSDKLLKAARAKRRTGLAVVSLYAVALALLGFGLIDRRRRAVDSR